MQNKIIIRFLLHLLIIFFHPFLSSVAEAQKPIDPETIFSELLLPYQKLNDYKVAIHSHVRLEGIRIPDFDADLFFKKPDKFHVETKKIALLPRNGAFFNPNQFDNSKNRITFERKEILNNTQVEVFKVEPVQEESRVRYFYVWIGDSPKRILQFEGHPFRGSTITARLNYVTVQGDPDSFVLPDSVHIHLKFPPVAKRPGLMGAKQGAIKDTPFMMGMILMEDLPEEGDIFISYRNWKVNSGLDDAIFQKDTNR